MGLHSIDSRTLNEYWPVTANKGNNGTHQICPDVNNAKVDHVAGVAPDDSFMSLESNRIHLRDIHNSESLFCSLKAGRTCTSSYSTAHSSTVVAGVCPSVSFILSNNI